MVAQHPDFEWQVEPRLDQNGRLDLTSQSKFYARGLRTGQHLHPCQVMELTRSSFDMTLVSASSAHWFESASL